jgi:aspartyl-tRNA(Asn)/glutamyl-tRNA(Gln) amidotransferase subunit A
MTIVEALAKMKTGEITSEQLVRDLLAKIEQENPKLNAYLEVYADAVDQAREADKARQAGEDLPLLGVPLAIKDNILVGGRKASAASKILGNYHASYDATVIRKLKEAGAILIGRTNMDEFAMGGSTENSAFGPTRNPHDVARVAGGSSGGSAAAVAAGLALGALGSDTGGSIRQPASFCGVVGLKPTYGAVSRFGLMAMASSLDQIGPFAQTVEDAELLFKIISGRDPLDSTSQDIAEDSSRKFEESSRMKIGVPENYLMDGIDPEVLADFRDSLERLKQAGHTITAVDLPSLKYSLACYYIIMPAEASTNLARFDGVRYGAYEAGETLLADYAKTRGRNFGPEVRRRIMLGTYVLSAGYYDAYYGRAVAVRQLIQADFVKAFKTVDVIAMPTAPTTAFKVGEKTADPLQMYLEDIFTVPANLAGVPAISIPSGKDSAGLPFGVQFFAPHFREDLLFAVGRSLKEV